jgi:hypothetical protein
MDARAAYNPLKSEQFSAVTRLPTLPLMPYHTLRDHLPAHYPKGVVPTREAIAGTAFFPGGHGLWMEDGKPRFPVGGIMVLGHDFHSEAEYSKSVERGKENLKAATWRNLIELLHAARIAPRDCFYTNFYMGLREGPATTGVFPGSSGPDFVYACQQFFLEQLRQQQPKVILVLGVHVPKQLAPLAPELQQWSKATTLKDFNVPGMAVVHQARFTGHADAVNVVMLAHTSQRLLNVKHRSYKGMVGQEAELGMVGDALYRV